MRRGTHAMFFLRLVALMAVVRAVPASAQAVPSRAPTVTLDVQALPSMEKGVVPFDPQKATNAYLARVSGKARQRSDAYFEGGYVLLFIDAAYAIAVSA